MEQVLEVEALGQDEDLVVGLGIRMVAWELAHLGEWVEERVEGVELVQVWVQAGIAYAHRVEYNSPTGEARPAIE
jgi:hypothetical protein